MTKVIKNIDLEQDEAGLWEMGVVIPFSNMAMSRFEQQANLYGDITAGDERFGVKGENNRIKPGTIVYVGPSSDPTRDSDGNLIYYGRYETFKISSVTFSGTYDSVYIEKIQSGFNDTFVNNYIAGDPIVFRDLAESWDFISDTYFTGITTVPDMKANSDFLYSREDSLDGHRGFSQGITTNAALPSAIDVGISQYLSGSKANILHLIKEKKIAISAWVRSQFIEEYTGLNYGNIHPKVIAAFYNKPGNAVKANAISTYEISTSQIPGKYWNVLISGIATVPTEPLSMKIGVFGEFDQNPNEQFMKLYIDDIVAEHVVGTSQEDNGRYLVNINPSIGMSVSNKSSKKTRKDPSGIVKDLKIGDPRAKLTITSNWENRESFFINDMRKLENWNKMGYPIALRPKMPGYLPNVMFCNIDVDVDYTISPANSRGDVKIIFTEVSV